MVCEKLVTEEIKPAAVVIGDDHRFGRNRGDFNALKEMGKMFDFEVIALDAKYVQDIRVSSTKLRSAVEKETLRKLISFLLDLFIKGEVVGAKLGSELGCPTANLKIEEN